MARVKLSEWCKQNNVAYITAYRWFKDDKFPAPAIQTESGTILVDVPEINTDKDVSLFVQKTIEFSNSNASISDFAAYVLNNFSLKANSGNMATESMPMSYNIMSSTASSLTPNSTYFTSTPVVFSSNLSTPTHDASVTVSPIAALENVQPGPHVRPAVNSPISQEFINTFQACGGKLDLNSDPNIILDETEISTYDSTHLLPENKKIIVKNKKRNKKESK